MTIAMNSESRLHHLLLNVAMILNQTIEQISHSPPSIFYYFLINSYKIHPHIWSAWKGENYEFGSVEDNQIKPS